MRKAFWLPAYIVLCGSNSVHVYPWCKLPCPLADVITVPKRLCTFLIVHSLSAYSAHVCLSVNGVGAGEGGLQISKRLVREGGCFCTQITASHTETLGGGWPGGEGCGHRPSLPGSHPSPLFPGCVTLYQFPPLRAGRRVVPTQDRCRRKTHCNRGAVRRVGRGSCPEEESCDRQRASGTKVGWPQAAGPAG